MSKVIKNIVLGSLFLVLVLFSVYLVAAVVVNQGFQNPISDGNISGTTTLRIWLTNDVAVNNITNASFYYSTDNATWTLIGVNATFNLTNYTIDWVTTGVSDGNKIYSLLATINNGSGSGLNYTRSNITVDNTAPVIVLRGYREDKATLFPSTHFTTNGTGIRFNVSATDAILEIRTCLLKTDFAGTYATNATLIYTNITSGGSYAFNVAVNEDYVNLSDGTYKWNVVCNDTVGNTGSNDTNFTLVIDSVAPSAATLTVPSSTVTFGNTVEIKCTNTDATSKVNSTLIKITKPDGGTVNRRDFNTTHTSSVHVVGSGSSWSLDELGTYKVDCTVKDRAGNSKSAGQKEFSISTTSSGSGGGGGGTAGGGRTYNLGTVTDEGTTRLLNENDKATFTIGEDSHSVTVKSIGAESVTVTVASEHPVDITLSIGDTKRVDFEQDNVYDFAVKLVRVISNSASLEFRAISESYTGPAVPFEGAEEEMEEEEGEAPSEGEVPTPTRASTAVWWIIGIIVLIVVIALIVAAQKKKR